MERLLTEIREPLFHHIERIVRENATAEDVLQDTLYTICRKLGSLREPLWFRAWCYRIATRQAIRRSRAERFWSVAEGDDALALMSVDGREDVDAELGEQMMAAIDDLPPASALVLRLHYIDGLSYSEIAEALEIAPGTVKSRASYGLSKLRLAAASQVSGRVVNPGA